MSYGLGEKLEREGTEVSVQTLAIARYLQTRDYLLCQRLSIDRAAHRGLEAAMRRYIVYLLERGLKSVDFIDRLRREEAAWSSHPAGGA